MTTTLRLALLAAATVLLGACSTIDRSTAPAIDRQAQSEWRSARVPQQPYVYQTRR